MKLVTYVYENGIKKETTFHPKQLRIKVDSLMNDYCEVYLASATSLLRPSVLAVEAWISLKSSEFSSSDTP